MLFCSCVSFFSCCILSGSVAIDLRAFFSPFFLATWSYFKCTCTQLYSYVPKALYNIPACKTYLACAIRVSLYTYMSLSDSNVTFETSVPAVSQSVSHARRRMPTQYRIHIILKNWKDPDETRGGDDRMMSQCVQYRGWVEVVRK